MSSALISCSQNDVLVQKIPATVEKVYEAHPNEENGLSAHTDWFFHCQPSFDYAVIQSQQTSPNKYFVQLEIKRVQLKTTLPIKIVLAKDFSPFVLQHEEGHVLICKTIYDSANLAAENAARRLIGAAFVATRSTPEAAQQAALDLASRALCTDYSRSTVDHCNRVSEIYDVLSHRSPSQPVKELVESSFKIADKGN